MSNQGTTPIEDLIQKPLDPPAEEMPTGDWYVKLTRRKDQRKYFIHRNGQTTARCDHIMLLPEEIAKQLAAAIRKNHPDFTAVAKKCPKRFINPVHNKQKGKRKRAQILPRTMEDTPGLEDCPFCGGQPFFDSSCHDKGKWFSVKCANCNCRTDEKATREAVAKLWNRRTKAKN